MTARRHTVEECDELREDDRVDADAGDLVVADHGHATDSVVAGEPRLPRTPMTDEEKRVLLHHEAASEANHWRWLQEIFETNYEQRISASPSSARLGVGALGASVSVMLRLERLKVAAEARERGLRLPAERSLDPKPSSIVP